MGRWRKTIIAGDIQKYMRAKGLIKKYFDIVIPEGGYTSEEEGHFVNWEGSFEVFSSLNDIDSYGTFQAMVPKHAGEDDDYSLVIVYKRKETWIFD